jgi:hypothetical protein
MKGEPEMAIRSRKTAIVHATLLAMLFLGAVPTAGQRSSYTPPRTPDGQPDLQGYWTNATYTPLERPNGVTKEFYTPEEAAALEKREAARESSQTKPGTTEDVHYDFSQFGLDRSQSPLTRSLRTSLIFDPPDGRVPPMTAEGKRRAAEREETARELGGRWDSAQSNQLDDRCIMMRGPGPPMMDAGYNSNYHIVQGPGYVMILTEMIHDARVIPLDGRPEPSPNIRQWMGISRGRWEGNTLVVETTNFNGKNPFAGSSENMRVTERFTRVSADVIQYRFTIVDESVWARPWSGELPLAKTNGPIFEHACHEGNYGLYNTLVGARLEEKRAAEAAGKQPR